MVALVIFLPLRTENKQQQKHLEMQISLVTLNSREEKYITK